MTGSTTTIAGTATGDAVSGAVVGWPRTWLRLEALAVLAAGVAVYLASGGALAWLLPLLLVVDVSMVGYLAGPRFGSLTYNLAHNWGTGLLVLGLGSVLAATPLVLAGAVLVAHVGMDRVVGYGLKYATSFEDTHLGRIGRGPRGAR